jgi:hypothetical protein
VETLNLQRVVRIKKLIGVLLVGLMVVMMACDNPNNSDIPSASAIELRFQGTYKGTYLEHELEIQLTANEIIFVNAAAKAQFGPTPFSGKTGKRYKDGGPEDNFNIEQQFGLFNSCYAKAPLSPVLKADNNSIALLSDAM